MAIMASERPFTFTCVPSTVSIKLWEERPDRVNGLHRGWREDLETGLAMWPVVPVIGPARSGETFPMYRDGAFASTAVNEICKIGKSRLPSRIPRAVKTSFCPPASLEHKRSTGVN